MRFTNVINHETKYIDHMRFTKEINYLRFTKEIDHKRLTRKSIIWDSLMNLI